MPVVFPVMKTLRPYCSLSVKPVASVPKKLPRTHTFDVSCICIPLLAAWLVCVLRLKASPSMIEPAAPPPDTSSVGAFAIAPLSISTRMTALLPNSDPLVLAAVPDWL